MDIVDDIRRETVDGDYQRVIDDCVNEFGHEGLTICSYGGRRPPISDLDVMVLTEPALSPRRIRQLRVRLDGFRTADPVRRYLVDDEIRMCPLDLFAQVRVHYPNMLPMSFQVLSGPTVDAEPAPPTPQASQVVLLDTILTRLNELTSIHREAVVSLREVLKTLQKLSTFVRPQIAQVVALGHRSYADGAVKEAYDAMADRVAQLRERAVSGPPDTGFLVSLAECMRQAKAVLVDSLDHYCIDFLRSAITPSVSAEPHASGRDREELPELVLCHIAAYSQVSRGPMPLRQTLKQAGTRHAFAITDEAYRRVLTGQMQVAESFDVRFRRLGIAAFPLAIAGEWHKWEPAARWESIRRLVGSAKERVGREKGTDRA